jgi:hypothetical protein
MMLPIAHDSAIRCEEVLGVLLGGSLNQVFEGDAGYGEAQEDLGWWESSDGIQLRRCRVIVKAKRVGESFYALLIPVPKVSSN